MDRQPGIRYRQAWQKARGAMDRSRGWGVWCACCRAAGGASSSGAINTDGLSSVWKFGQEPCRVCKSLRSVGKQQENSIVEPTRQTTPNHARKHPKKHIQRKMSATTRGNNSMIALCFAFLLSQVVHASSDSNPYVQNNGSLDGYYEQDGSSSSSAEPASSESTTKWWTPESNTWSASAAAASEPASSESATKWWTPESNTWSAPAAASEPASSESTTKWWTPESNTWTATALASTAAASAPVASAAASTPVASAAASSPAASAASGKCQAEWAQCGGADFTGASCCQEGLTCVSANSYWARCVSSTTLASGVASQPASAAAPDTAAGTGTLTAPAGSAAADATTGVTAPAAISAVSAADNSNNSKPTAAVTGVSAAAVGQSTSIAGFAKAVNSISKQASASSSNGAAPSSANGGIAAAIVLGLGLVLGM